MQKVEEKEINAKEFYKLVRMYLPPIGIIIISMLFLLLQGGSTLLIPLGVKQFIDKMSLGTITIQEIVIVLGVFCLQLLFSAVTIYLMNYNSQYVISQIRNSLWNKILKLPICYFDQNASGDIMSRISNDTFVLKEFITSDVVTFISGIISILISLIFLFVVDWKMTLLTLIAIPATVFCITPLSKKMYTISKATQEETAKLQSEMSRVLTNIRLVKSSRAECYEKRAGMRQITALFRFGLKEGMITAIIQPFTTMAVFLLLILVFGYGSMRVSTGSLTAGSLVAIIYYMFQIATPCMQLTSFFARLQKAIGAAERVDSILKMEEEKEIMQTEREQLEAARNKLSFYNVFFRYKEGKPVLENISFEVELGTVTAIVGPSGVGKTTIFSLLERFYYPEKGTIYYRGKDINTVTLSEWRKKIAYVTQDASIMAGSIKDNLVYGREEYSMDEIIDAVQQADLEEFIKSMPKGYNTQVGEHGIKLSGGQRQRIAIARAILRKPEILLLDEATAHLDSCAEKTVLKALERLMKGKTTLVIAHRLSTVKNAEQLIVLENGKISGSGNHDSLMSNHLLYQEMVRQQFCA